MRAREIFLEAGLELSELRKHGGKYFNILIDKISKGDTFDVEASLSGKFPDGVKIDPIVIPKLLAAFYPDGDKDNAETDASGRAVVVDSKIFRTPLKLLNSTQTIPLGAITKTKDFKGGKDINFGVLAEGILGAAIAALFVNKGENINPENITSVLKKLKPTPIAKGGKSESLMGTYNNIVTYDDGKRDRLKFMLKLSKANFNALMEDLKSNKVIDPYVKSLIKSAVMYVNGGQEGIAAAVKTVAEKSDGNLIEIITDGISDNKGTKADLTLRINGQVIKLISLKAMGSSLFGQVGGSKFESFQAFLGDLFDIDVSKHAADFVDEEGPEDKQKNLETISKIYRSDIGPEIKSQLDGDPETEARFIEKLANGIIKHATLGQDVEIVKFNRSVYGGAKVLKVDQQSLANMKKIKFSVKIDPAKANIEIYGKTSDPELGNRLGTTDDVLLVKMRSYYQTSAQYVRNVIEMGPLLEELTIVTRYEGDRAAAKARKNTADLKVGKITKKGERDVRDTAVKDVVALGRTKKAG